MKTLSIISQKGGVGKTTLSINLAYTLAKREVKLLLIDTDPQSSVAMSLSKNARSRKGFYDWMNGGKSLENCIMKTKLGMMHVMTAGQYQEYAKQEWSKDILLKRLTELKKELEGYDLVMVDTAAGLMDMTELMILNSDFLMVPEQAEPLSVRSLPHMMQSLQRIKQVHAAKFKLLGIILTMAQSKVSVTQKIHSELYGLLGKMLMPWMIERDLSFLEASHYAVPVELVRGVSSECVAVFQNLAQFLVEQMSIEQQNKMTYGSLMD